MLDARNRFLIPDAVWGLVLAAVSALAMTYPYKLTGFLAVALFCAAVSGATGTLVALSAFVYTLVGGLLLGPLFRPFVERAASKEKELVR